MTSSPVFRLPGGGVIASVPEDAFAETMLSRIEPELALLRTESDLPVPGGTLHMEHYILPQAQRAILLLHGYTESACKLRELAWYFLQAGFSVFSYDHRGHGRSLRPLPDSTVAHVEHFSEYVEDAETVIRTQVKKLAGNVPLYLFAHSMGGAVGAQLLVKYPDLFARAILSSPMIAPSSAPFPLWMGRAMAGTFCLVGKGKQRAFIAGPFDPKNEPFETSSSTSRARFDYYQHKRVSDPQLQVCAPSYRWVLESVRQTVALMDEKTVGAVQTPVLLCQASRDTVVLLEPQNKFVSLLPHGRLAAFDAKHEIYMAETRVFIPYVQTMLDFLLTK